MLNFDSIWFDPGLLYLRSAPPEVLILDKKLRRIFSLDLPSNWHNWRGNQMPFFLQTIYFRIKLMLQYIGCILFPCLLKSQFSRSFFLPIRNFKVNCRVNWLYLYYFLFSITSLECFELGFWRSCKFCRVIHSYFLAKSYLIL